MFAGAPPYPRSAARFLGLAMLAAFGVLLSAAGSAQAAAQFPARTMSAPTTKVLRAEEAVRRHVVELVNELVRLRDGK